KRTISVPSDVANPRQPSRHRPWAALGGHARAILGSSRHQRGRRRPIMEYPAARYGLAIGFVIAAAEVGVLIDALTGRFLTFPFYAAVVASAWFGIGPGVAAFILSALSAADFATPDRFAL